MRALALLGLLLLQEPDVESLLRQLSDDSIEVREKAAAALIEQGSRLEDQLRSRVQILQGETRVRLESVLSAIDRNRKLAVIRPPLKRVALDAKEMRLSALVADLRRQTGVTVRADNLEDLCVTAKVSGATLWEAMDAICKAGGLSYGVDLIRSRSELDVVATELTPWDPQSPVVRMYPGGYPDSPRVLNGRYMVSPVRIEMKRWSDFRGSGSQCALQLHLNWPPDSKPTTAKLEVTSAIDDKGKSILEPAKAGFQVHYRYEDSKGRGWWQAAESVQLTPPDPGVRSIRTLKGKATVRYFIPDKALILTRADLEKPRVVKSDGLAAEVLDFKVADGTAAHQLTLTGLARGSESNKGTDNQFYVLRLKLEDGSLREYSGQILKTGPDSLTVPCKWSAVTNKVSELQIIYDWSWQDDSFEFELSDIQLPK